MPLSKRVLYNLDYLSDAIGTTGALYALINHIKGGASYGPVGLNNWTNGTRYWTRSIDANGWPNVSGLGLSDQFGGAFYIPTSANFAGSYVLAWDGDGNITFLDNTWTEVSLTGAVKNSSGNWSNTGGSTTARIVLTVSGSTQRVRWRCNASGRGSGNSSQCLTNLRFYRLADETDYNAGKIYRSTFKQMLINFNPGCIRFMNWFGGNAADEGRIYKYSHRPPLSYATWAGQYANPSLPQYGSGTQPGATNAIVVSGVAGTPASMQHGEVCTFTNTNALVRVGVLAVSNIADNGGGTALVTTTTAHGFNVGDNVIHYTQSNLVGMHMNVAAIATTPTSTTYTIPVNVVGMGTWTGTGNCTGYATLQVGSGNDRIAYPMVAPDGMASVGYAGSGAVATSGVMGANQIKTFVFDKKCVAAQGVQGAWVGNPVNGAIPFLSSGVPTAAMVALITELKAQGWKAPIDMWISIPYCGMLSTDPDYSSGENIAVNTVNDILATLPSECNLWVEFSNETWNYNGFPTGPGSFAYQGMYLTRFGYLRNNTQGIAAIEKGYGTTIRALMCAYDIKQNIADARVKHVLAGQGTLGYTSHNVTRITGNSLVTTDAFFISLGITNPIDYFDAWAFAAYIDGPSSGDSTNVTTYGTAYNTAVGNSDPVGMATARQNYVTTLIGTTSNGETLAYYQQIRMPGYATMSQLKGKPVVNYEAGWDHSVTGTYTAFLTDCQGNYEWARAWDGYVAACASQSNMYFPAIYVQATQQWAHSYPDTYDANGNEGGNLDVCWQLLGLRNNNKRRFKVAT